MAKKKKYGVRQEKQLKEDLLLCLEKNKGQIYKSLDILDITPTIYYEWKKDEAFASAVDNRISMIKDIRLDHAESMLEKNIAEGNQRAIEFLLSRQGVQRGWGNKSTLELEGSVQQETFFRFGENGNGGYSVVMGENVIAVEEKFKTKGIYEKTASGYISNPK